MSLCPCDSGSEFSDCCSPFLKGHQKPATAEQLIRARYTAHTFANIDYIQATHHPDYRDDLDIASTREWAEKSEWLGLEIRSTELGGENDQQGKVEFIARFNDVKGKTINHHELSLFEKLDDEWYFVDAEAPRVEQVRRSTPKTGRNDPCPCGSGKKFKKCCAAA